VGHPLNMPTYREYCCANFAWKLSEKSHERANLLAIKRLIAT
jgi:hypothetical protein